MPEFYLYLLPVVAGVFLALGIFIGRADAENRKIKEEISELESLSNRYQPTLRECNDAINRINAAGLQ